MPSLIRHTALFTALLLCACADMDPAAPTVSAASSFHVTQDEFDYQGLVDWFAAREMDVERELARLIMQRTRLSADDAIILRVENGFVDVEFPFEERTYTAEGIELRFNAAGFADVTYIPRDGRRAQPPARTACHVEVRFGGMLWVDAPKSLDPESHHWHKPPRMRLDVTHTNILDIEGGLCT